MRKWFCISCLFLACAPVVARAQFDRDLFIGTRGNDVKQLQQFLKDRGPSIYPEGLVTGYFGPLTREAVKRFQALHAITPVAGYFGPKTRRVAAVLTKPGAASPQPLLPPPAPTPPPPPAPFTAPDTKKPTFLKTPRAAVNFSEAAILDAETDEIVGYSLTCDRPVVPIVNGSVWALKFRVKGHAHYNCQLVAEDQAGNASSRTLSFDTPEWFEVSGATATTSLAAFTIDMGRITVVNNSAETVILTSLPVRFGWAFAATGSPNVGAPVALLMRDEAGIVLGRTDRILDMREKTMEVKLNTGSIPLQPDQQRSLSLSIGDLRAALGRGEFFRMETASTTAPAELDTQMPQRGLISFYRSP